MDPATMKIIETLGPEIYKDGLKKVVKSLGDALGDLASIVPAVTAPIGAGAIIWRANLLKAAKKIAMENPEDIIEADPNLAIPIMQKMLYVNDDTLADAYAEMLKNTSLKSMQSQVLPVHATILSNLTPDEVRILDFVCSEKNTYKIPLKSLAGVIQDKGGTEISEEFKAAVKASAIMVDFSVRGIPFLEVRGTAKDKTFNTIDKYLNDLERKVSIVNPKNIGSYIENLGVQGIFIIRTEFWFAPVEIYKGLEKNANERYKKAAELKGRKLDLVKGEARLTDLAESFLKACRPRNKTE